MFYNYVSRQKCSKARVNNKIVAIGIQHIAIQSLLFFPHGISGTMQHETIYNITRHNVINKHYKRKVIKQILVPAIILENARVIFAFCVTQFCDQ